ncbi:MAG: NAD(P)/FAD-dependent oxidoreductase [Ruminiclostridium sp.]|nr:NAD(P)/FAD-dependent oxidoreductase [Ruminiclostridium sp.]
MEIVIIGNHCAGVTAAETLRKLDKSCRITVISREDTPPYSRCLVNYIISGKKKIDDILFRPVDFYKTNSINTIFGVEATNIYPESKEILLNTQVKIKYDKLLVATGASPVLSGVEGENKDGVFVLRTMEDALKIRKYSENVATAVVLGGGLVGIKAVTALFELGKKVKLIVSSSGILSQNLDADEAEIAENYLISNGIDIIKRTSVSKILGSEKVEGVKTSTGEIIDCQMVIVGKGVEVNKSLIGETGIEAGQGIIVDDHCRTSVPDIYAAGDVVQSADNVRKSAWINALWPFAAEEGRVAAENMLGKDSVLRQRTSMNSLNLLGLPVITCGLTGMREKITDAEKVTIKGKDKTTMKRFVFKGNKIVGFVLIGDIRDAGVLNTIVRKEIDISGAKDSILSGRFDFASMLPVFMDNCEKFNDDTEKEFKQIFKTYKNK